MLKILTANQIKSLDAYTIEHDPISSIDLMERACRVFVTWFAEKFDSSKKIGIVCGTGNNGGDGLGIARVLYDRNYSVKVWVVRGGTSVSDDFKINLKRLEGKIDVQAITSAPDNAIFSNTDIIIDAIVGSGLSRPVEGIYAETITCINKAGGIRIAVDVPSGLMTDAHSEMMVVKAQYTISFQLPKLAFLMPENSEYVGEWRTVNITLNKHFIEQAETSHLLLEKHDAVCIRKPRSKFSHKGTFGKALLIAGSKGKIGAAVLASKAVLRAGAGLLTTHVPGCGYTILQTAVPEVMVNADDHDTIFTGIDLKKDTYDAIGIGPGIGMDQKTVKAFTAVLKEAANPMVIDADGLNILASHSALLHIIPAKSILTPHPKEFERLVGPWKNDFERLEKLKDFASQTKTVIILKGAYTSIAFEDKVYFNPTGNPGMATGGSGDVLTGILTGLLAQGYSSLEAAQLGVYLHGLSGDLAVKQLGMEGLIASDFIDFLPQAFQNLLG